LQQQKARVTLFARNVEKAQTLADLFNISCESLSSATFAGYDLVINTTPLGSGEHIDKSPATAGQLNGAPCIYDLIYNPIETKLMREARQAGCETLGGMEMLVAQAKLQFQLWTGKQARLHRDQSFWSQSTPRPG
jgi:shikimate 5-dehydrogenase